jgi:fused signal recognition particle receptor
MKFGERLKGFFKGSFAAKFEISDELFEDLCDVLIEGDFGAAEAYKMTELLRERCKKETPDTVHLILAKALEEELDKAKAAGNVFDEKDQLAAVLILGVNGVGKTTTTAKLAHFFKQKYNKRTILAAADTFRAAAVDQLKIHGQKLDMRVIAHKQGGDPAAVVYDALEAAISGGADAVIADTAGRMHTKTSLVEELRKIDRVVESKAANARYLKYLILDATTGRNALAQAEIFHDAVSLDGVILTKYDSTAKGGVVIGISEQFKIPVKYIGIGEKMEDLQAFNRAEFVNSIL